MTSNPTSTPTIGAPRFVAIAKWVSVAAPEVMHLGADVAPSATPGATEARNRGPRNHAKRRPMSPMERSSG